MEYAKTVIRGVKIIAFNDGSIEWIHAGYKRPYRTFGTSVNKYKAVRLRNKHIYVHRIIAKAFLVDYLDSLQVDHIDGDKANNNPSNLRMVTHQENSQAYQKGRKNKYSLYRGVTFSRKAKKWMAQCKIDGSSHYLGLFECERGAAIARDAFSHSNGFSIESMNFPEHYTQSNN